MYEETDDTLQRNYACLLEACFRFQNEKFNTIKQNLKYIYVRYIYIYEKEMPIKYNFI